MKSKGSVDLIAAMLTARLKVLQGHQDQWLDSFRISGRQADLDAANVYRAQIDEIQSLMMMIGEAERKGEMVLSTNYCRA